MSRTAGGKVSRAAARASAPAPPSVPNDYWRDSERPLTSLVFLLPLIALYECGAGWLMPTPRHRIDQEIIAFILIRQFFSIFGASARLLPAMAVAGILLSWHLARKDSWKINPRTLLGMVLESVTLAVPVLMLGMALPRWFPLAGAGRGAATAAAAAPHVFDYVVLFFGAGVYEELVFRLGLLTFLSLILRDAFQMRSVTASVVMVLTSGLLFSAYHHLSPAEPPFRLNTFVFRSVAGIYFGILFLTRGFGVTAASHAAYDIFVLMLSSQSL